MLDMVDVGSAQWDEYSCFAPRILRPMYALEARRLREYEAYLARNFDRIVLATSRGGRLLRSFAPEARTEVVPNGVDFDFFKPLELPKAERPTLLFTGQMDYFANVDGVVSFVREIFPALKQRFPDLDLLILGRSPTPAVRALIDVPGVFVTGAVGDVRPFLSRAWMFVAPLRSAQGAQNQILEAMAMNLPVVCTDQVFALLTDGGFRHGRDLLIANTLVEWERCISGLLEDARERERLAGNARQRLVAAYSWDSNLKRFEDVLLSLFPFKTWLGEPLESVGPAPDASTSTEEVRGA